ncbi:glutamine-rich protein 2-like [Columba livia]|uniref:glutamine-rich protein 2-like n=1 Tax=Columba livia TaxID=8932 RepID=UPI0031B9F268
MATRGLLEMLNAAMGTPHLGVVDLVALHKLLEAIIGQLGQQELSVLEPGQSLTPGLAKDQDSKAQPGQEKEEDGALGTGQHLWKPKKQLDEKDTLDGTGSNSEVSSVAKEAMPKTTEEEERDVSKKRASLQDLWEEISKFKEAHSGLEQDVRAMQQAMQEAHSGLEQDIQEVKEAHVGLAEDMHALQEAHSGLAEDIQEIQETLGLEGGGGQSAPAEPTQVATDSQARRSSTLGPKGRGTQPGMETSKGTAGSGSPRMQAGTQGQPATPVKLSGAPSIHTRSIDASATTPGMQPGSPGTQASTSLGTQPGAPDAQASTAGMQAGSPATQATTPGVQPGSSSSKATIPGDAQEPAKPWGSTSTSSYESEMREVLSQVGQLGQLCTGLKEQVEQLKSTKAESADLENVRRLFPKGGRQSITSILADLRCQVSFLQDMTRALHGEEEKISKVEDAPRKTRGSGAGRKADGGGKMTQQPRPKGQKVKAERKELEKQQEPTQAELEQFAAKYVNNLVMETAQQLQAEQVDELRTTAQSGGHEHAGCHVCSPDTRVLLGKLLQRCKKLEEQVESLVQKAGSKVESHPKWRRQSLQQDEQLKCLQASIMQLQKDYEKLSSALANLQQDRQALSQALGRLEKKQADKEQLLVLGIDEKADKAALADKVSRSQLEACEERLNKMMEEVTSRVTGQEKGWHQFQRELQRQMDCKLDRRELGAFRQQQEERWKSLSGQLQEKALQAERDDAAGIRKQLLPGFHCLSCDRPLNMLAPGPERTGECRYPTVPRSCGGQHTVTPPRFQPQPPSTPRPSKPSARSPNKKDAMQLSGQDGTDGNQQDEQLSVMGGSELPTMPRATPETSTSRNRPSTRSSLRSAVLQHLPVSSPRRFTLAPKLLPPIQPPRNESSP